MAYEEDPRLSRAGREENYRQMQAYIDRRARHCFARRRELPVTADLGRHLSEARALRKAVLENWGYPPAPPPPPRLLEDRLIGSDELCGEIRRLTVRVDEELDCQGILLLPRTQEGAPRPRLALCYHGGGGCPEYVCGMTGGETNYHSAARTLVSHGYAVFAPLFTFFHYVDQEDTAVPQGVRHELSVKAQWTGTTLAAIELMKVEQSITALDHYPGLDTSAVGVCGLSYGGFYALYTAALLPRVAWCISSCYFNDRLAILNHRPDILHDWVPAGAGCLYGDASIAQLICPRPLYIEVGSRDEIFPPEGAVSEAATVARSYRALGLGDKFIFDVFDGVHEFSLRRLGEFLERV